MTIPIEIILEGTAGPEKRGGYLFLPFEVPPRIGRIDVQFEYSDRIGSEPDETEGNTVDIDIYDPRSSGRLADGFRGGSGSSRTEFSIGLDDAMPGYMSGPIQAGTWQISLGLYKVWRNGCHYKVMVRLTSDETGQTGQFLPLLPLRTEAPRRKPSPDGWYKGRELGWIDYFRLSFA